MSVNSISNSNSTIPASSAKPTERAGKNANTASASSKTTFDETAAVYEKSNEHAVSVSKKSNIDYEAIKTQMKADLEARQKQLMDIVNQSIGKQGMTFAIATENGNMKDLFANLKVDADTIAQAKEDISEDGYWGVEKTSDRILDFAKALAGDDASKAEELLEAFKKGFKQATKSWGDELPSICQDTYKAVEEKFQDWINETENSEA